MQTSVLFPRPVKISFPLSLESVGASFARDRLFHFQLFFIEKVMFERRNTLESEVYFCEQARELLKDKYILIIGDSVQVLL